MKPNTRFYVQFLSPGTFLSESSEVEMPHDQNLAVSKAREIVERHGARPYGFRFITKESDGWESKAVKTSNIFYIGGRIRTLEEVEADNKPDEATLRWNMRANKYQRVVENNNSYKSIFPLNDDDVVLDVQL